MRTYPPGPVTRAAAALLLERIEPLVIYRSADEGIQWYLNCMSPMLGVQEGAALADGVQGLHPPFSHIDHKGARQHGVTNQHTVYDAAEYDMEVEFSAAPNHVNPEIAAAAIRRVIRDWIASWDPMKPGTLTWITPDQGRWTCTPRLFRSPPDKQFRMQARRLRQKYTWTIRNDDAFWKGVDSVSDFRFKYQTARDLFNRDDVGTLGPQWQQTYTGAGAGLCETDVNRARWVPSGNGTRTVVNRLLGINEVQVISINGAFTGGTWTYTFGANTTAGLAFNASAATVQTAITGLASVGAGNATVTGPNGGPYVVTFINTRGLQNLAVGTSSGASLTPGGTVDAVKVATMIEGAGPSTATDNQVVVVKTGDPHQWPWVDQCLDIWARLNNNDASPTGVRVRIDSQLTLSRFNAGVETVMKQVPLDLPPLWWEEFSFVCGSATNARQFKVQRNGFPILDFAETGTGSVLGASNRGAGWGMKATPGTSSQNVPVSVVEWSFGDNSTITQSGHLKLTNFGDQDGYARFLVYGPCTVKIANGPDSDAMVEFGPLADKQIALLTVLPRLRGVVDLSPEQPVQILTEFQKFMKQLIELATNGNVPPLLEQFESFFGILPPQGEMYPLLKGRFTNPIPPKPTGAPPSTASLAIEMSGGNADSRVIAALTPLRRWPE